MVVSNSPQPKMKKAFWLYIAILGIIGAFTIGFYSGKGFSADGKPTKTSFINTISGKTTDVDFQLFWDTYDLLEKKFVDRPIDKQKVVYGAIEGMVKSLDDPYTAFMTPDMTKEFEDEISGTFEGIGVEIGMKEDIVTVVSPIQDSPGQKAGLQAGDAILKIDSKTTIDMSLTDAVRLIRGKKGTTVHLTIQRKSEENVREFDIVRDTIAVKSVEWSDKGNGIFYIKIARFSDDTTQEFEKAINEFQKQNQKKLIVDVRNNPGGFLESAIDISSQFIEDGIIVIEEYSKDKRQEHKARGEARLKEIPVIVLINGGSASASEILAGALRDDLGTKLVGQKTFGKGSVQEFSELNKGASLRVTIAKWLTPNGTSIHGNGLAPDVSVDMSEDDYKNNKDPQLDKALELIKQ